MTYSGLCRFQTLATILTELRFARYWFANRPYAVPNFYDSYAKT